MATWTVVFDNEKAGRAGQWWPHDRFGELLILDEYFDILASTAHQSVMKYTTADDASTRAAIARALDNNVEVLEWDVTIAEDVREAIAADAYAAASAVAPVYDSTDQVGWRLNDEDFNKRVLAYIRARGYDPRDILGQQEWICDMCGELIPYNQQCLGHIYVCETCAQYA